MNVLHKYVFTKTTWEWQLSSRQTSTVFIFNFPISIELLSNILYTFFYLFKGPPGSKGKQGRPGYQGTRVSNSFVNTD